MAIAEDGTPKQTGTHLVQLHECVLDEFCLMPLQKLGADKVKERVCLLLQH